MYHLLKQRLFLEDLQAELAKMEEDIRSKKEGKEIKEKTAAEKEEEVAKRAQRSA